VHPPVDTEFFTPGDAPRGDHFLYAGRFVGYKRPDLVVEAFRNLPELNLRMIGTGPLEQQLRERATPNIRFLGSVSDEQLREEYRTARAMIFCAHEDFGIVMAEAQSCGTPVVALARGGALDIVDPGVTGWLIDDQDPALLRDAIRTAATTDLDNDAISAGAQRFSRARYRREMRQAVDDAIALKRSGRSPATAK
jgi:glycosyltransferase involved in cell wall biosynthesis